MVPEVPHTTLRQDHFDPTQPNVHWFVCLTQGRWGSIRSMKS